MASITPYLASIGLLADDAPTLQTIPTTSVEYAPVEWPPSSLHTESTSLLDSLQKQYGRAVDVQHDIATRKLASYEQDRDNAQARAGAALAAMADERAALERVHTTEMETHRRATAVALRSMHAELESLRSLHTREVQEVKREADEEHGRLRDWCAAQLAAVEANRDALMATLAEKREWHEKSSESQMEALQWKHAEQQQALRQLLAEESERLAQARQEVLNVTLAAGNERLALQTALSVARKKAADASDDVASGRAAAREAAAEREAELREALKAANRRQEETANASARELAIGVRRAEDESSKMRRELERTKTQLTEAQGARAKAEEKAIRLQAANAKLADQLRQAESDLAKLRSRLNSSIGSSGAAAEMTVASGARGGGAAAAAAGGGDGGRAGGGGMTRAGSSTAFKSSATARHVTGANTSTKPAAPPVTPSTLQRRGPASSITSSSCNGPASGSASARRATK